MAALPFTVKRSGETDFEITMPDGRSELFEFCPEDRGVGDFFYVHGVRPLSQHGREKLRRLGLPERIGGGRPISANHLFALADAARRCT